MMSRCVLGAAYWERAYGNYRDAARLYLVALHHSSNRPAAVIGLAKTLFAATCRIRSEPADLTTDLIPERVA